MYTLPTILVLDCFQWNISLFHAWVIHQLTNSSKLPSPPALTASPRLSQKELALEMLISGWQKQLNVLYLSVLVSVTVFQDGTSFRGRANCKPPSRVFMASKASNTPRTVRLISISDRTMRIRWLAYCRNNPQKVLASAGAICTFGHWLNTHHVTCGFGRLRRPTRYRSRLSANFATR